MSYLWPRSGTPTFSRNGQFASGAQAFFFLAGTSTPLTVFSDAAFAMSLPAPVAADQNGVFPGVFIPYGAYRARVVDQNAVLLSDLDNIDNLAPAAAGGGIVVTQDMVLQTGDPVWRPRTGIMSGFVRMNGNSIGSTTSGATELANASTQNLFLFLWNNFSNVKCPVSGGRGASPGADFAANKNIGILSMQGITPAGLDDMGGASAGVLQAVTTCTTNGTATVTVVSAAGIAVGDSAIVNGVSIGPVVSINGTTVVLTSAAAGAAAGISFRSSRFADATVAANTAGGQNIKQTIDQIASHAHTYTDPGHAHNYTAASPISAPGGSFSAAAPAFNQTTGTSIVNITINNAGGGNPLSLLQPTMVGTFYMKL